MITSTDRTIEAPATRACPVCTTPYEARKVFGSWLPPDCGCVAAQRLAEDAERPARPESSTLADLERSGVNVRRFGTATLSTFDDSADPEALEAASAYIESWPEGRYVPRDWMYLYGADSKGSATGKVQTIGAVGNGKTHLGIAIARRLIEAGKLEPKYYRFTTVERFLLSAEATFRSADDSESKLLDTYERFELLHLDDLGVRDPSPHAVRMLDELAKAREGRATIWTSNLSPKLIAEQAPGLARIVSRLAGECGDGRKYMVAFSGPDRRVMRSRRQ